MKKGLVQKKIWKYARGGLDREFFDDLAQEEPLEIFIDDLPYSLTMRLPGDDLSLVQGLLFSDGIIDHLGEIAKISPCQDTPNRVHVALQASGQKRRRDFNGAGDARGKNNGRYFPQVSMSSCGVCGKLDLGQFFLDLAPLTRFGNFSLPGLFQAKSDLESRMGLFYQTGCIHAVAVYSQGLELLAFGEDIGRHNAFDKCLGQILSSRSQEDVFLAVCSSRLSLEMVQKAARVGVQVLAGMSAATSLAVDQAQEWKMTLIGFLRAERCNIYTWPGRICGLE